MAATRLFGRTVAAVLVVDVAVLLVCGELPTVTVLVAPPQPARSAATIATQPTRPEWDRVTLLVFIKERPETIRRLTRRSSRPSVCDSQPLQHPPQAGGSGSESQLVDGQPGAATSGATTATVPMSAEHAGRKLP